MKFENINTSEYWDSVYKRELQNGEWRSYPQTFLRVCEFIKGIVYKDGFTCVTELGCGTGILGKQINAIKNTLYTGYDISSVALEKATFRGLDARYIDLTTPTAHNKLFDTITDVYVACEILEHLDNYNVTRLLNTMSKTAKVSIIAVPNNVLGFEECSEHMQMWNPESLNELLSQYWEEVEILEFMDVMTGICQTPVLMAICSKRLEL